METLIDELAVRAGVDPFAYRRTPEARSQKLRAVDDLLEAQSADWRRRLPKHHAVGIACHESFGTGVACAVDVSIENKRPRIHRATVAVDCGLAVNPLTVESQFQAGLAFGLSQLMARGAITLRDGMVEQRNFDSYAALHARCAGRRRRPHRAEHRGADRMRRATSSGDLAGGSQRADQADWETLPQPAARRRLVVLQNTRCCITDDRGFVGR